MSAAANVYTRLSPSEQSSLLRRIVERCEKKRGGEAPIVVFDLDGTLMDNRPRTAAILRELGETWRARNVPAHEALLRVEAANLAYLLTESLARLGITESALVADAEEFWRTHFFGDEALRHDVPLAGSVDFARACYDKGATLVYLTGRDLPMMGIGSFRSLRDTGFPIGVVGTELVLKPDFGMPDEAYKRLEAPKLSRMGHVVAAFDNEPANCNIFLEAHPECDSVFVDTQHLPGAPPLVRGVSVVADFRIG